MSNVDHQYGNLISEIKNCLNTRLKESVAEMFNKFVESLFDMADSADNNEDRSRYFELAHDVRTMKDTISVDFITSMTPYLRPFAKTEAEKKQASPETADELTLVDQADLDDIVLIKSMGDSVSGLFTEQLSHLETRLEHLALQTPDIFAKKSLHPINIFQAFDDALGNNFDATNKKILFKFFNDLVALKLGQVYDEINSLLIDAGILPQIKLHATKSAPQRRPGHTPPPAEGSDNPEQSDPEQDMNQGGYAMTAAPGHSFPGSLGQAAGNTAIGGAPPGNTGSPGNSASAAASYHHITAGMPASQVGEIVGQYLSGAPMLPPDPASEAPAQGPGSQYFPSSTGQYYGHEEILSALSSIQQNPAFSNTEQASYDAEAIKQAVISEIAKSSGGAVTKSINRIAEKTIDFIELIFDAIIDDDNISDTIKTILLRLQIPVIKASMIDQEFFIYDEHPARVLLDKIANVGIGINSRSDEVYIQLDKIVTTLVNEFELQADSFKKALDTLNAFLEKRDAEALKKEEEAQKKVLREHARSTVLKALRTATRGKVLPETIHALVLKRWPTMMYNHYLKHGKENDEWVHIVDTLRSIINSVQPLKNADELHHLIEIREPLIKTTRNYLQITNQSEEDVAEVIQCLIDMHQSHIDQSDFDDKSEIVAAATVEEPVQEEPSEPKLQLPTNMAPGMWFQVYTGEDKAQRRCKLSVVILEDQKLIFVNYQGEVIVEKNLGEFLDEIAEGKSKVIMGHSVFDHALSSVVTGLQKTH